MNPGDLVGPYRVVGKLGEGGMGEVYRARDTRLPRDVAIKALPASAASDADRTARFEREAQILAGINHPHIAALFGLEQSGASQFLVMELFEGGTLAERLAPGPLPLRDSLEIARQIADALQAAHERGIIHRDLKPANIGFTSDGHVKVLDFGLAKIKDPAATSTSGDALETVAAATRTGVVMGTAAYMSPEQARGQTLDKRSDIFAFGCVLFEMLTGRNPFGGASISDILVAILERDPDWALVPAKTPARVQWLLRRCLEKDPRRRLQDIGDARIELDEAITGGSDSGSLATAAAAATASSAQPRVGGRELAAWGIAVLAVAAAAAAWLLRNDARARGGNRPLYHTLLRLPQLDSLKNPEYHARFAVAPDGQKIAMMGTAPGNQTMLWLRSLDSPVPQPIAGTEGGSYPFWSPDSRSLGFTWRPTSDTLSGGAQLKRIDLGGGQPVTVADTAFPSLASWGADGVILFTPSGASPLYRADVNGGPVAEVTTLDKASAHVQHAHPFFLPDGRSFLYTIIGSEAGATASAGVYVASLDRSAAPRLLIEAATQPTFAAGHLFYVQGSTLFARPFDAARAQFTGAPATVTERVLTAATGGGLVAAYSVSASGVVAYQTSAPVRSQLAWFDRAGKRLESLGEPADWVDVALAPDNNRLATSGLDPVSGSRDIWVYDVRRGLAERLTSAAADEFAPVWSPKGDALIFSASTSGVPDLYRKAAGAEAQRIDAGGLTLGKFAASWSPDGRVILFIAGGRTIARSDLMLLPTDGGTPSVFLDSGSVETQGRFSPDGRWIAYAASLSGRLEVYVKPYGRPGEARRISANGGRWPRWRRDSSEIVFVDPDETFMSAAVTVTPDDVQVRDVRTLFPAKLRPQARLDAFPYDMTSDAQRFIVNTLLDEPSASTSALHLIINWRGAVR